MTVFGTCSPPRTEQAGIPSPSLNTKGLKRSSRSRHPDFGRIIWTIVNRSNALLPGSPNYLALNQLLEICPPAKVPRPLQFATYLAFGLQTMASTTSNGLPNGSAHTIRFIPSRYDSQDSQQSATRLILAVRPEWASPDSKIEFVRFTDGITNTLLKAINKKGGWSQDKVDSEAILLRAYGAGTAVLIDREREAQNHALLMKYGLAPELIARFNNGMLYRYIKGRVTTPDDLRKPSIYCAVARRLAQWHATVPCIPSSPSPLTNGVSRGATGGDSNDGRNGHVDHHHHHDAARQLATQALIDNTAPGKLAPNLWTVMRKWILALPTATPEQRARQSELQEELDSLVKQLSQRPGLGDNGLVFAHCDLLCGNVIVLPPQSSGPPNDDNDDDTPSVSFIDYEYATPSPAAFDLANHFAEWGGFECDHSVLPTRSQRQEFIQQYIESYYNLLPGEAKVDRKAEVAKLNAEVDLFRGIPGFYWGIWALIQAIISDIDFDYASYAETRLAEYWAWKAEADASRAASGRELPLRERRWCQDEVTEMKLRHTISGRTISTTPQR
ncbi:kinase-like protein [Sodiomyces alkalinus F11]|uniref:ethanolamine kinase n=1 Tax=Sodiomyces alkalinus (strain CBS 110278 / VKM F-3762 / F11) TaxID=1314773 RepID=A0A3N2PR63_SODAK|nr:kinase-like protein [Sodiomyces alkalinus F11]ROT37002.1 kinase-like protein [Sodiomyces alkalinus F11]